MIPQLRRGAASSRPSGSGPGVSPEPASVRMPPSTCLLCVSVSRSFSRRDARSPSRGTPLTASRRPSCPLAGGAALRGNIFLCLGRAALETRLPVAVVPRCPAISPHRRKKAPSAAAGGACQDGRTAADLRGGPVPLDLIFRQVSPPACGTAAAVSRWKGRTEAAWGRSPAVPPACRRTAAAWTKGRSWRSYPWDLQSPDRAPRC